LPYDRRALRALEQRSHRDARCNTAGAAGVPWTLCALLCAFVEVSAAYAQPAATLNGYRATPLPGDGFVVSGAAPSAHLELSLQLHADYANTRWCSKASPARAGPSAPRW
jgi:hypothetical protein